MLVFVGFFILTFTGGVLSGLRAPPWEPEPCPKHQHYTQNEPQCRKTCANRMVANPGLCKPISGCICDDGFVRLNDDATGPCVPENKCPPIGYPGDQVYAAKADAVSFGAISRRRSFVDPGAKSFGHSNSKSSSFSSSSSSYTSVIGCGENKCKDPNAVFKDCPNPCPLTCAEPNPRPCSKLCLKNGCECASGFILSEIGGKCIRPKDCPAPVCCPKHSHYVINDQDCRKTCGNRLLPGSETAGACVPYTGCVCDRGYVRKYDNATGPCIPKEKCPRIPTHCGINEEPTSCRIICPPQSCESIFSSYYCLPTECEPGCNCLNGYLRNDDDICIPSEDCFKPDPIDCGPNEVPTDCEIVCPPQSCESLYTTYMCAEWGCTAGCNCIEGFLRNSLGMCIPSEECYTDPSGCNGDANATHVECGSHCPPTCAEPDSNKPCILSCVLNGCECNPGYILSKVGGVCIDPDDCPGGSPICRKNQTYVDCLVGCPTNYCPADDSRAQVACSMPYPCLGGCACNAGYLIVSHDDRRCVLASDCPEVDCTRPNEVWEPNPSNCFLERCEDRGSVCDQPYPGIGHRPRCVCKYGYYRNASDICVPASECPGGCKGDPNASWKRCPTPCPNTCADPDAESGPCIEICLPDGCVCNPGYVLTEKNGVCIKPKDCPVNTGCNGDLNATHSDCPSACPITCANRNNNNENLFCPTVCLPSGCVCKPGYILTEIDGQCVSPEDCPVESSCNGDPNAVYSDCPSACQPTCANPDPNQPCMAICLPGGCVCKPGYVWTKKDGKCIKPENCPEKGCNGDRNATYQECLSACPLTCADQDPYKPCIAICLPAGCACNPGYVLTGKGGICIKPEDCPAEPQCHGDRNATFKECPSPCQATCDEPDTDGPCIDMCLPDGCVCKTGYLRKKSGGQCIKPEDCPGGTPKCGANETYAYCKVGCPTNYCPVDDSLAIVACDPMYPCPGGCVCLGGYLIRSEQDNRCILSSECPPVKCTRPNEVWNPKPPGCLRERCDDRNTPCDFPYPGPPRCVCKHGYFRNQDDICVPESKCPPLGCNGDLNATYSECPSACPATCGDPNTNKACIAACAKPGCVCNEGYILSKPGGICIKPSDCKGPKGCKGDQNATFSDCPSQCPATCRDPNADKICIDACAEPGCVCNEGYLLSELGGICIKPSDCPVPTGCNGDQNATFSNCPSACPATCCEPDTDKICIAACAKPGCVCNEGYLLSQTGGICIKPSDCEGGSPHCGKNMTYTSCKIDCPMKYCPETEDEIWVICDPVWPCPSGCECKSGYLMHNTVDRTCILAADCPKVECTRPNEVWDPSPSICNYERCSEMYYICDDPTPGRPKCVCKNGYYKDDNGVCIPAKECP